MLFQPKFSATIMQTLEAVSDALSHVLGFLSRSSLVQCALVSTVWRSTVKDLLNSDAKLSRVVLYKETAGGNTEYELYSFDVSFTPGKKIGESVGKKKVLEEREPTSKFCFSFEIETKRFSDKIYFNLEFLGYNESLSQQHYVISKRDIMCDSPLIGKEITLPDGKIKTIFAIKNKFFFGFDSQIFLADFDSENKEAAPSLIFDGKLHNLW